MEASFDIGTWPQLALGLLLAGAVALGARRASMLTSGGAIAAAIVGTFTFGIGGLAPSMLLLTFFISSSLLSRQGSERKRSLAERSAKGGKRDEWQVLANGAVPALLAVGYGLTGQSLWLVGVTGLWQPRMQTHGQPRSVCSREPVLD